MKRNVFEKPEDNQATTLSHSAQTEIIASAKLKSVGTLQGAMKLYAEQHNDTLKHGIDDIEALFPEYKDLRTGAPELITRDQGWVNVVMNKVHKSPISRILPATWMPAAMISARMVIRRARRRFLPAT